MKIAIHNKKRGFSRRWINYCDENNIAYKSINCCDTDIIQQIKDCDGLMYDFDQNDYKAVLFARQLLYSMQMAGKKVFPDFNTCWHFDDKVGQKYLLESINAPFVPSYVFYTRKEAIDWLNKTTFPKVFKLRGGAGSANVSLAKNKREAKKFIAKAFGRGFSQFDGQKHVKDMWGKYRMKRVTLARFFRSCGRFFIPTEFAKMHGREKGYVYFQDFIPDNLFDIRVIVIGEKAFAFKRMVRKGDFRASGSGNFLYGKVEIDERCVKIAFEINKTIKSQSIAYDFVFDKENNPLIVEISYGFIAKVYDSCEGYWDKEMNWHEGQHFDFCGWMVENLITETENRVW
jgi:glutathione synthase/RimK-type ligase-like ATP-grasp enzyme